MALPCWQLGPLAENAVLRVLMSCVCSCHAKPGPKWTANILFPDIQSVTQTSTAAQPERKRIRQKNCLRITNSVDQTCKEKSNCLRLLCCLSRVERINSLFQQPVTGGALFQGGWIIIGIRGRFNRYRWVHPGLGNLLLIKRADNHHGDVIARAPGESPLYQ